MTATVPAITIDPRCYDDSTANVVNISGGKDSLAQWLLALEHQVPNLVVAFADTGHEHPLTYDYIDQLERRLGPVRRARADFTARLAKKRATVQTKWVAELLAGAPGRWRWMAAGTPKGPVPAEPADVYRLDQRDGPWLWLSARPPMTDAQVQAVVDRALAALHPTGNPFVDLCLWKGRFPSTRARFCSFELKHEPIRTQIIEPLLAEYDEVISWQGVRAQESAARRDLAEWVTEPDGVAGLNVYRPIHQWTHDQVFALAARHGIAPNPLYAMGCSRVGCMPCVNVNKAELREIFLRFPEVVAHMTDMERLVAAASKRGNSTFFASSTDPHRVELDSQRVTVDSHGFATYRDWALSSRGGRNFDLLAAATDKAACSSVYAGVCE